MILDLVAMETGVRVEDIRKIVRTASHRYREYDIPKRTRGKRRISQPTPELKFLQRWLNRNVFNALTVHESVFSYRFGIGISDNAKVHLKNDYLLKVDFANFFPSIKDHDIRRILDELVFQESTPIAKEDIGDILSIVCRNGELTIGAPSSPILSNAVLYDLDCFLVETCSEKGVFYTRYADDLYFSTNVTNTLAQVFDALRSDLERRESPRLEINNSKTVFTSRKRKRMVTGVVLTSDGRMSVGRKKKRAIRTLVHMYSRNQLSENKLSYLRGYLSFISSVEPEFLTRIRRKFGDDTIDNLLEISPKSRKPRKRK